MKAILYFLIFLNSFFAIAQSTTPALKVYLEDAYTGKNIKDAKVTLEGFEIPEIIGKYNKKGKYYYFDVLPAGYNTVMAYHKKYNEKGLQDKVKLPGVIKLQLCDPLNVSDKIYDIQDSVYAEELNKIISSKNIRNIRVEDPYKIVIASSLEFCYKFENFIQANNIGIEIINPLNADIIDNPYSTEKISCDSFSSEGFIFYNCLESRSTGEYNSQGYTTIDGIFSLILRKKDGTRFKRFNDPVIKKLNDNDFNVYSIFYPKYYYHSNKPYKPKITKYLDKINHYVDEPNKSKVFLYNNYGHVQIVFEIISSWDRDNIYMHKQKLFIDDLSILKYDGLGLGILDQYDYFYKIHTSK